MSGDGLRNWLRRGFARGGWILLAALVVPPGATVDAKTRVVSLPKSMLGAWTFEAGDCDPQSEGRLTVEHRTILFFASAYDVRRIVKRSDGSLLISGLRAEEGEGSGRTRDRLTLKLIPPERLHVVTGSPEGHVYHRCHGPASAKPRAAHDCQGRASIAKTAGIH